MGAPATECVFCRKRGAVAVLTSEGNCLGRILEKGDGVLSEGDLYGSDYKRVCVMAVPGAEMVVVREKMSPAIVDCTAEL